MRPAGGADVYSPKDHIVRRDLKPVGRIWAPGDNPENADSWEWSIHVPGFPMPPWGSGQTSSLEEAKSAFLDAWTRFYGKLEWSLNDYWQRRETGNEGPRDSHDEGELAHVRHLMGE
jgi:hypothetical protein